MAHYAAPNSYILTDLGTGQYAISDPTGPVEYDDVPDTLQPGDILLAVGGLYNWTVTYIGQYEGGIVTHYQDYFFDQPVNDIYYLLTEQTYDEGHSVTPEATSFAVCFLTGVEIMTPEGPRAVETLAIGDLISTANGGVVAVKWVGRQTLAAQFAHGAGGPVLIEAGALSRAFGAALPTRDLKLTADHALAIGGVLVQAGALVNGATIRRLTTAETGERYVVWHIETEGHQVILAEGVPAETFVDNVTRRRFDNHAQYEALYGAEAEAISELELPRVKSARQLPLALRAMIETPKAA